MQEKVTNKKIQLKDFWFHIVALVISIILAFIGYWFLTNTNQLKETTYKHRQISRSLLQSSSGIAQAQTHLTRFSYSKNRESLDQAYIQALSAWGMITPFIGREDLPKLAFNELKLQEKFETVIKTIETNIEAESIDYKSLDEINILIDDIVILLGYSESRQWSKRAIAYLQAKERSEILLINFASIIAFLFLVHIILYLVAIRKNKLSTLLEKQQEKLTESSKLAALGEFSATVVHEINNPLTVIQWRLKMVTSYLEELISGDPKLRKNFNSLEEQTTRIDKIIKGIKLLSKNTDEEQIDSFDITLLKNQIEDLIEAKSKYQNFDFKFNIHGQNRLIKAKQVQLSQVLTNLVNNSIDAIRSHESKWIRVDAVVENDLLSIDITDSGKGLSKKAQESLFKLFYSTKSNENGTGIGLNLSAKIIAEHGGELTYNPYAPNTQFQIQIPQ